VVPPEAEVWYYIRADKHADVEEYYAWILDIAEAAARMTRTELTSIQVDADVHERLPNRTLAEILHRNLEEVGPPRFTEEEKAFARSTQASFGRELPIALSEDIEPLPDEPTQGLASTDVGDISWSVPTGGLRVATYTLGAPGHSWQIVACTGTSIGEKGMLVAAKTLAGAAIDLMASPELIDKAGADLIAMRESLNYVTLIPEGQKAPQAIR
jgi:aminobenzoyl-glutamate utilization protein B